ncbi:MAG: sodium ion-translocating decarboxylase subunit beta [Oscillospiraceae bacterium]|jgi:oxaloacetate decarboxylase beta subunit|nr:sodium ion-translocating decarboxylase subunit beta [Oscillospiraceae bacterium]
MIFDTLQKLWVSSGFANIDIRQVVMIVLACVLLYLGIVRKFEPLLLVGIAFGMLLTNMPTPAGATRIFTPELWDPDLWGGSIDFGNILHHGGLFDILYIGVKSGVYPSLIFLGVGAMTDFGPMLANPRSLLLGAAAQLGIYCALILAIVIGFNGQAAGSIAIIGGADGPTAIWLTTKLSPKLLGPIAIAAYSYMALVPMIQPPIMRALTTKKEREIKMEQLRFVSKKEKILFPIVVSIATILVLPSVAPLIGSLMLGNLLRECGVVDRLSDTVQNSLMNIVVIFLSISVGATTVYYNFLKVETIEIIILGLVAFAFSTVGGVLLGKLMCWLTKGKINPLIGSAGVSAVPMAARVSQKVGQKANPSNYLLMHAMGPNVAGVIGSAVAAGFLLAIFGG